MIRPFTALCFCAFAGAGAWLYGVKHSVAVQDRELREIRRETEAARERITVLRAEWSMLNEPDRLRGVAVRHLQLEAMQPTHFARANEVERRLPAAVAFAGAPDLFAPPPGAEPPRGPAPGVMLAVAQVPSPAGRGTPPAAEPARVAEAPAPQALAAAIAASRAESAPRPAAQPAAAPRPSAPAARPANPPVAAAAPTPAAPPRPIQPAIMLVPAAESVTRVTRSATPETTVASALGGSALGRPMLAPPVPIGAAQAATLR